MTNTRQRRSAWGRSSEGPEGGVRPRFVRGAARRARRGMTLLEVMVAVVVVLVMAMMVAESLRNSIEFNELLSDRDGITRQARVAMSKIRRDIQLAFLTPHQLAVENFETVFVGMDGDPDQIFFSSLSHQRIYRDSRECDQTEITIWTEPSPSDRGTGYVLYHRESQRIDGEPDEGGVVYPLAYNVRTFSLRYLDAQTQEWVNEWDTRNSETPYRLPRAVELGLVLIAPDPEDRKRTVDVPFMTTILLQYGQRIPSPNNPFGNASPLAGNGGNPMFNMGGQPGGQPGMQPRGGGNRQYDANNPGVLRGQSSGGVPIPKMPGVRGR